MVCGEHGFMNSAEGLRTWAPAYSGMQRLARSGVATSLTDYKHWMARVSTHEFADELVLAATARLLRTCIVTIPFTPPSSAAPWAISYHPCAERCHELGMSDQHQLIVGNDDVHYVCLLDVS